MSYLGNEGVVRLRKKTIVLGLILLMCAFPVTVWAAEFSKKANLNAPTIVGEIDEPRGDWNVTAWFTAGERLIFDVKDGPDWAMYADESIPEMPSTTLFLPVDVSIIDPMNETTNFTIFFQASETSEAVSPELTFFGGNLTSNDGGLIMEAQYVWVAENQTVFYNYLGDGITGVGGIAKHSGYYTAVVSKDWGTVEPPMYLKLYEQGVGTVSPYLFVVPIGLAAMVSGITLSVWASKQPKQPKQRIKKQSQGSR
jgi:hypothetical protein